MVCYLVRLTFPQNIQAMVAAQEVVHHAYSVGIHVAYDLFAQRFMLNVAARAERTGKPY